MPFVPDSGQFIPDPAPQSQPSEWDQIKAGLATAPINMYLGAKQFFGGLSPVEQDVLQQNKEAEKAAPVSSFLSNVGTIAPTLLIPGSTSIAGAGLIGGGAGALQPVQGEQSAANIAAGKLMNTGVGTLGGMGSQALGNKLGQYLQDKVANQATEAAVKQAKNASIDATTQESLDAGYNIPRSQYNPSFVTDRLESVAGKAATNQQAGITNQEVTNSLAKQALGLPDDMALSKTALEQVRNTASAPYQEIAKLSPQAATDLEALKQARNDAQGWFNAYNRSASPNDLKTAKQFQATAEQLEQSLQTAAQQAGRPDLIPQLQAARVQIAKSYTVQRALNDANGDVSAPVLGRLFQKEKPLTDGLDTIGKFNTAYPQISRPGANIPAPGVSKAEALTAAMMAMGGLATGHPAAAFAGLLPLASHPARSLALSKALQQMPTYGPSAMSQIGASVAPAISPMARALAQYLTPSAGAALTAQ